MRRCRCGSPISHFRRRLVPRVCCDRSAVQGDTSAVRRFRPQGFGWRKLNARTYYLSCLDARGESRVLDDIKRFLDNIVLLWGVDVGELLLSAIIVLHTCLNAPPKNCPPLSNLYIGNLGGHSVGTHASRKLLKASPLNSIFASETTLTHAWRDKSPFTI